MAQEKGLTIPVEIDDSKVKTGIENLKNKLRDAVRSTKEIGAEMKDSFTKGLQEGMEIGEAEKTKGKLGGVANAVKSFGNGIKDFFKGLGQGIKEGAKDVEKNGNKSQGILTRLANAYKKLGQSALNSLKGIFTHTSKATNGLGQFLKAGIGLMSLASVFRFLKSSIKEGLDALVKYDGAINNSISALVSSLATLKNALASAFAPIINIIAPILTKFVNMLTMVASKIANVIAVLTGKNTFIKATKVNIDYAQSLDKTSSSTKKKTKETKKDTKATKEAEKENKKYMSGLDEIATWQEDKSKDAEDLTTEPIEDPTADLGGGIGGAGSPFEKAIAEMPEWLKKLKDLFDKEDWFGLGYEIAEMMADGLNKLYELVKWDNIKDKVLYYCDMIIGIINGIIANEHFWTNLGKVVGALINDAVQIAWEFLTKINWKGLGESLGTAFTNAIKEIDWNKAGEAVMAYILVLPSIIVGFIKKTDWKVVGKAISDFFISAFNYASKWIQDVDWVELGQKVKEAIVSIDWAGVAKAMFEAMGSALGALAGFLWGLIKDAWAQVCAWWKETAYEDGKFTIQGLFDGILDVLKNVATWIKENIFTPFIEGFKKAFGIASPSTVMMEQGKFIMEGLLNGIESLVDKFKQIWENLKTTVINVFNGMWNGIKGVINSILGGVERMANGIIRGINGAIEAINGLSVDIPDWVPRVGGKQIGFNIPTMREISIPKLATGAIIPPNAPFLATLGDQKNGNNFEAPEGLLRQVVREESGGGNYQFVAQINRRTLFDEMISEAKLRQSSSGRNPFSFA